jgi:chloramphenicol O-acetyltransferase type A
MKKVIDLTSWNRREHFAFFSQCDEPFHGIVANIDCDAAYQYCKQTKTSFFLFYLHRVLQAINDTEAMRYRIEDGQVVEYARIHANATISRADNTFGFCPIQFHEDFSVFSTDANSAMDKVKNDTGLCFTDECKRNDAIHFSAMPWINFTGITHARRHDGMDSVPKISAGKCHLQDGKMQLPVASFVHHGLVDAYHIHQFLSRLQQGMNELPEA